MKAVATAMIAGAAMAAVPADAAGVPSGQETRAIAARYATCVIKSSTGQARRFVMDGHRAPPIIGNCLTGGGKMSFRGQTYRYVLAEALVLRDYPMGPPDGLAVAPAIERPEDEPLDIARLPKNARRAAEVRDRLALRDGIRAMDIVTECVVRREPAASHALVRAPIDTTDETQAFARLKPALAECLSSGDPIRMNRSVLRGSIATNLYRLSYAVRPVTT